jgi:DNA polymerase-3 subunit gamma/tau
MYVAKNEDIRAEEEALHIIGQKADGALRDALSIFDQIVSLTGKTIAYKDVIENLNVLDYEYYFKTIDAALMGDVSAVLISFNEILEKGFDGHNFISGLNSHLRDLLVSRDESTLPLLETTASVKQRYLKQTGRCQVDFLFRALEIGTNCDLTYKNSKNQRLHAELALIRLCRLMAEYGSEAEKKKHELNQERRTDKIIEEDITLPAKASLSRPENQIPATEPDRKDMQTGKHTPVYEKPGKTFSIKDIISDDKPNDDKPAAVAAPKVNESDSASKPVFSAESFESCWPEFVSQLSGEGSRIISMFKTIKPEVENDQTIRIHLSNATQKDTFIQNYKQRLINFLNNKFILPEIDIETTVDIAQTDDVLYTDEQKFTYLFGKYPVLKEMKKNFNLDIT